MTLFGRTSPSDAEAERRHRRRWILVPGVVVLLCVVVGMVTALGPNRSREATISQAYPKGIDKIVLDNPGDVAVASTSGPRALAAWETHWNYQKPAVRSTRDGDTLRLRLDCSASVGVECFADLRLVVPENVALDITSTSGDVMVNDVTGPVSVDSASGDVGVYGARGDVDVRNASGDLRLGAISGDVTADTKSGEIQAEGLRSGVARLTSVSGGVDAGFAVVPRHVTARARSGDVDVRVPEGTGPYQVRQTVRSGDADIGVSTSPSASSVIDVAAISGDVRVGYEDRDEHGDHGDHGDRPDMPERPEMPEMPG